MARNYKTFDEIDRDLQLLRIQREIDRETMRLSAYKARETFSAAGIVTNVISKLGSSMVLAKVARKLIGR